jgi:hypothetical protein
MDQHGSNQHGTHQRLTTGRGPRGQRLVRRIAPAAAALAAAAAMLTGGVLTASSATAIPVSSEGLATTAASSASTLAATALSSTWPTPTGTVKVSATIKVTGTFDGGGKQYYGIGDGSQSESQDPMFEIADGGTVKNVIIGTPAGDGIHCKGTCLINNVWWQDVGEDAATQKGTKSSEVMTIDGGGAQKASDKVFQQNGPGTMVIKNFVVKDFGKLYRSCGNCKTQYKRSVVLSNVLVIAPGKTLVGINTNYGDKATISAVTIQGDSSKKIHVCAKYVGNATGAEPPSPGYGADSTYCLYSTSGITYK